MIRLTLELQKLIQNITVLNSSFWTRGGPKLDKQQKNDKRRKNRGTMRALANFSQIGVTMAASVLIGVFLGRFLDGLFNTSPWLLLLFSFLGAGAAIRNLFDMYKKK